MFSNFKLLLDPISPTIAVPIYLNAPYGDSLAQLLPQTTGEASRYLVCCYMLFIQPILNTAFAKLFPAGLADLRRRHTADVLASALVATMRPSLELWSESMFYLRVDASMPPMDTLQLEQEQAEDIRRWMDSYHQNPKSSVRAKEVGHDPSSAGTPDTRARGEGNNTIPNAAVGPNSASSTDLPPIWIIAKPGGGTICTGTTSKPISV